MGQPTHTSDLASALCGLDREVLMSAIVRMNHHLLHSFHRAGGHREVQEEMVGALCDAELRRRLGKSAFAQNPSVVVFHRQQLMLLLRLVLILCPPHGGQPWTPDTQRRLVAACLMVNDLISSKHIAAFLDGEDIVRASLTIPASELAFEGQEYAPIGRGAQLWLEVAGAKECDGEGAVDIASTFVARYGMAMDDLLQVMHYVYCQVRSFDPTDPSTRGFLIVRPDHIPGIGPVEADKVNDALRIVSVGLDDLADSLFSDPRHRIEYDFTAFRRSPIVEIRPRAFVCPDRGFLVQCFTDGLYWLVDDAFGPRMSDRFRAYFGRMFQEYVVRQLRAVCPGKADHSVSVMAAEVKFGDDSEFADLVLARNGSWAMIELKGILLNTRVKYAGDADVLEADIRSKFVTTRNGRGKEKRKGVSQLANGIRKLAEGQQLKQVSHLGEHCTHIYPAILCYDRAATGHHLREYLSDCFTSELGTSLTECNIEVHPLVLLSVEDIEAYCTVAQKLPMDQLLAEYGLRAQPLESFRSFVWRTHPHEVDASVTRLHETWTRFSSDVLHRFFPRQPDP